MRKLAAVLVALGIGLGGAQGADRAASAAPATPPFGPVIEGYQPYAGQTTCDPVAKPGVLSFRDLVRRTYAVGEGGIERACGSGGTSEHKEGRAWDMPARVDVSGERAVGQDLLAWLLATDQYGNAHAMARRLGLMYVIWNRQVWKSYQASRGWQPYTGSNPHTDHIHFSFSWEGAWARTSFFVPMANEFMAYARSFTGGVNTAAGNIVPGGDDEVVTGTGVGGGPHVRVLRSDKRVISEWYAYSPAFSGGIDVAVGDLTGDGVAEIVTAPGPGGGPHIRVFDAGGRVLKEFMAYDAGFSGGVHVALTDENQDGVGEIVTAPRAGGGPHVRVFQPYSLRVIAEFFAYNPGFTGGVDVAGGDVNGDGVGDIVTGPGPGGGPHVAVFGWNGRPLNGFMAYTPAFTGGVDVSTVRRAAGTTYIVLSAGVGGGPHVRITDSRGGTLSEFFGAPVTLATGICVTGANFGGGDGEILVSGMPGALPFVSPLSLVGRDVPGVLDP